MLIPKSVPTSSRWLYVVGYVACVIGFATTLTIAWLTLTDGGSSDLLETRGGTKLLKGIVLLPLLFAVTAAKMYSGRVEPFRHASFLLLLGGLVQFVLVALFVWFGTPPDAYVVAGATGAAGVLCLIAGGMLSLSSIDQHLAN